MDWDIFKVGGQFGTNPYTDSVGDDGWYGIVPTPSQTQHDETRPSLAAKRTIPSDPSPSPHNAVMTVSPYVQQNTNIINSPSRPTYAAVVRLGTQESAIAPSIRSSISAQDRTQYRRGWQTPEAKEYSHRPEKRRHVESWGGRRTYAEALRSCPNEPITLGNHQQQAATIGGAKQEFVDPRLMSTSEFDLYPNATWSTQPLPQPTWTPGHPSNVGANTHLTSIDLSGNFNWQPGIAEGLQTIGQWAEQPRTANDRTRPQPNPPQSYQDRLPNVQSHMSFSSPPSSRTSGRRNKEDLIAGNYEQRCETCHAGFDTFAELNHHLRSHTPYEQRPHGCDSCRSRFMYRKDLIRHQLVHNAAQHLCRFDDCKYASIGFKRVDHLERHLRTRHAVDSVQQMSQPSSAGGY